MIRETYTTYRLIFKFEDNKAPKQLDLANFNCRKASWILLPGSPHMMRGGINYTDFSGISLGSHFFNLRCFLYKVCDLRAGKLRDALSYAHIKGRYFFSVLHIFFFFIFYIVISRKPATEKKKKTLDYLIEIAFKRVYFEKKNHRCLWNCLIYCHDGSMRSSNR